MSYKSELQSNNADLLEILNQINAMPEGGGGAGGGGSSGGGVPCVFAVSGVCANEAYAGTYTSTGSAVIE